MVISKCPECKHPIELDLNLEIGQKVVCPGCHGAFEVIWLYPVCLDYPEPQENPQQTH